MKIKVLITVEGGIVQNVSANTSDVDIMVVDYDDDSEEEPVVISGPSGPDHVFTDGKASNMLNGKLSEGEAAVKQYLKQIKF